MFRKKADISPEEHTEQEVVGELMSVQDINNFFKHYINPALTEAKIERATAANLKGNRTVQMQWFAVIAIILIGAGICYTMISNSASNSQCIHDMTEMAKGNKGVVAATQPANNNPLSSLLPNQNTGTIVK